MGTAKLSKISQFLKGLGTLTCVVGVSFMCTTLTTACSEEASSNTSDMAAATSTSASNTAVSTQPKAQVVLRIGYENAPNEPFDLGMKRWKEELETKSNGSMSLELYPSSSLGTKNELIERMSRGEPVGTLADGGTFYGLEAYNLGITFGPYLFKNWDEAFHLTASDWYKTEIENLAKNQGIRIIPGNWAYGVRHILTNKRVTKMADFKNLVMRVTGNDVQEQTMKIFGAKTVRMDLTKVNAALRSGEVNGLENPISHLYGGGYYKNAKFLLLSGHVYNFTHIIVGDKFWQSLTEPQRQLLTSSCQRAAKFFNVVEAADEYTALRKMKAEGVIVTEPTPSFLTDLNNAAHSFYVLPTFTSKWTPGLFYKVLAAKSVPWTYYTSHRFHNK